MGQITAARSYKKFKAPVNPRDISVNDFPEDASIDEQLKALLHYVILSPSIHNTQPWLFKVLDSTVEIHADRSRALPVIDPEDQFLVMSCGFAIGALEIVLDALGFTYHCSLYPDIENADLLVRVTVSGRVPRYSEMKEVLDAIKRRRSIRSVLMDTPLPESFVEAFSAMNSAGGGRIHLISDLEEETELLDRVRRSEEGCTRDIRFLRERKSWTHPMRERSRDGIPVSHGSNDLFSAVWEPIVRTQEQPSSLLALACSAGYRGQDLLEVGSSTMKYLINASKLGVNAAIRNYPGHLPGENETGSSPERNGIPLLLLRFGTAKSRMLTPRRPLYEVMLHPGYRK